MGIAIAERSLSYGHVATPALPAEFAESPASLYTHLAGIETHVAHPAGALLFADGDEADAVYVIAEGLAMTYKMLADGRRQVTGFLFPGDMLGLTFEGRHICGAETLVPCRLRRYAKGKLDRLIETSSQLERYLLRRSSQQLLAAQSQFLLLGRKTAQERMASFLCQLARRQVERGEVTNPVWHPMSQTTVADYLGLTLETVSRVTASLRRKGLITTPRRHFIRIEDMAALEDLAEGIA